MIIVETTSGQYRDRAARLLPNLNESDRIEPSRVESSRVKSSRVESNLKVKVALLLSSFAQEIQNLHVQPCEPVYKLR